MKRYLFVALIVASSTVACKKHTPPSETAWENRSQTRPTETAQARDRNQDEERTNEIVTPEHRQHSEMATSGPLPDTTQRPNPATTPRPTTPGEPMPVDTGVNDRDRNDSTMTPMDQGESEADIQLTQTIRQSLMENDALSFSAKNVKIITRSGQVTLRGAVASARERALVEDAAKRAPNVTRVENQLEIIKK